ncbi:MAG: ligase-associated DNA damage response endonuclease PdeM [Limisphaerales bacterium]
MNSLQMLYAGETLTLFADKALFWNRTRTLIIADPHFGKASAFRHAGIPVPEEITKTDLARLDHLLQATGSERLMILGDFFHAKSGRSDATMSALAEWCERHSQLRIFLVPGNHDLSAGRPPDCWNIVVESEWQESPFTFLHEPATRPHSHVLAGHLHPSIRLGDGFGAGLRAACFWFGNETVVLPAFGSFTGTHPIRPAKTDQIFAVRQNEIFAVPPVLLR